MKIFNPHVFTLSNKLKIDKITPSLENIFIIENFYDDINLVYDEIQKLPMSLIWNLEDRKVLKDKIIDGRKSHTHSMSGTELPYINQLPEKIYKYMKIKKNQIYLEQNLLINCSKKLKNYPKNCYYNIHIDSFILNYKELLDQFAIIVFLNKNYDDNTSGLNIYDKMYHSYDNDCFFFTPKNKSKLIYFIQAKPNRAVLIPRNLLHGPEIGISNQFYNEWRYTQVIFLPIFKNTITEKIQYT